MKRTTKHALATIFAGLFAIGLTFAVGTPAVAAQSEAALPADSTPDRIIYVNHAAPSLPENVSADPELSTEQVKVRLAQTDDLPLIPEDGETVRIIYTDAVADVSRAGQCTKSLTAFTPYLSGGNVWLNGGWTISTGCSSGDTVTIRLLSGILTVASKSTAASNNGWATTTGVTKACKNNNSADYRGVVSWSSGGPVTGPSATLNCRT